MDNAQITKNTITGNFADGVNVQLSDNAKITGQLIATSGADGLELLNSRGATIVTNTIIKNAANGIFLNNSSANTVGGTTISLQNIIAGNQASGITISEANNGDASHNLIEGNFIGLDANGNALPNSVTGVLISSANNNTIGGITPIPGRGPGNVISGNDLYGIEIANGATGTLVEGNLIGTDPAGSRAIGNTSDGVFLINVSGNTIGGTAGGSRNIISGNLSDGVRIFGAGGVNNLVQGNFIGVNMDGTGAIGNQSNGVLIDNAGPTNPPGAFNLVAGNVISGNAQSGVAIVSSQQQGGNIVSGNLIGTDLKGASAHRQRCPWRAHRRVAEQPDRRHHRHAGNRTRQSHLGQCDVGRGDLLPRAFRAGQRQLRAWQPDRHYR